MQVRAEVRRPIGAAIVAAVMLVGSTVALGSPPVAAQDPPEASAEVVAVPGLRLASGMSALSDGSVLVGSLLSGGTRRVHPDGTVTVEGGLSQGTPISAITVDSAGMAYVGTEVFVPGFGYGQAVQVGRPGDGAATLVPLPGLPNVIQGLAAGPGGRLVIANGTRIVYALDAGATQLRALDLPGLGVAGDVLTLPDGSLVVADRERREVLRYAPGWTSPPSVLPYRLEGVPAQLELDQYGSVYVSDGAPRNRVLRLAPGSSVPEVLPATTGFEDEWPSGIAVTPEGDVYVGYPGSVGELLRLRPAARIARLARYVDDAYRAILLRESDPGGRAFHAERLFRGEAVESLTLSMARSGEARRLLATEAYRSVFGRSPDAAGLAYWASRLVGGLRPDLMRVSFIASAEMRARHPGDEDFVRAVYRIALGRDGTGDAGVAYWVDRLRRGEPRSSVARVLLSSGEAIDRIVDDRWAAVYGGAPTPEQRPTARQAYLTLGRDPIRFTANLVATTEILNR